MRPVASLVVLLLACGGETESASPGTPAPESASPGAPTAESARTGAPATSGATAPAATGNPADCERVRPCAEAFAAVAPPELAGPARVAAEQLDHTLVESPARAAACTAAITSFRADLERLALEVPEACR